MKKRSSTPKKSSHKLVSSCEYPSPEITSFLADLNGHQSANKTPPDNMTALQYAEELYHYFESIIAAMPNNVYWLDKNCTLLGGNDNLARMLDLKSQSELVGLTYKQMAKLVNWTEDQGEAFKKTLLEIMSTGVAQFNVEEPPIMIDGKLRYFISNKVPLYNSKQEVIGVIGISTDISERKIENLYLKNVINKLPGSIYWKNKEGVYLGCNDFVLQMAGMNSIVGKTDFDMPWQEYADQIRSVDESVMKTNKPIELEEHPTLSNGQQIIMLTRKAPLNDERGETLGIIGISVDITENKKILEDTLKKSKEKVDAANKAKTEFLENMRHDIRTPLAGITGFASIIRDEVNDPKVKEYVDNLTASSYALLDLLNEILEVIKVNSGDLPQLKKKFNLKKRLSDIVKLNQAKASYKNIELIFEYDDSIPHYLIGDPTRIHRIALELTTNALNFTHKGSVKLIAKLAKTIGQAIVLKLIIEDTGIGIPSDQQQEIFIQFKRLTPSYEGIYKGAGLGLAIVRKFLDEIEGEIYVESRIDVGTKFTCLIPLKKSLLDDEFGCEDIITPTTKIKSFNTLPKISVDQSSDAEIISPSNRILVIEDSFLAAAVAKNLLSKLDCQVDVAPDGKTAVKLAQNNQYDLIFIDIGLPDINGYEVTKRIRLHELSKGTHIPIIALTAHIDDENKQRCIEVGMNAVLAKPLIKEKAEDILNAFIPYRKKLKEAISTVKNREEPDLFHIESKIIDIDAAKKILGNNEETLYQMLEMLQESLSEELLKIQSAYDEQDWLTVQAIIHKIIGSCTYCGAVRLKEACTRLEASIKSKKTELIAGLYKQLTEEIKAAKKTIEAKNY